MNSSTTEIAPVSRTFSFASPQVIVAESLVACGWKVDVSKTYKCSEYYVVKDSNGKTLAIYVRNLVTDNTCCLFTTGHFNDNFTPDNKTNTSPENWIFGIGKMIVCRHEVNEKLSEASDENMAILKPNIDDILTEILKVAEKDKAKGKTYVDHDPLVAFAKSFEVKSTSSMSYKEVFDYWMSTTGDILNLIPYTSARIAKEAVGRKLPFSMLGPFGEHSETLTALIHAYLSTFSFEKAVLLLFKGGCEEISKDDDIWAKKTKLGLGCFDVENEDTKLVQQELLEYAAGFSEAQKKLGKAIANTSAMVRKMFESPGSSLIVKNDAFVSYFEECGYFRFFEEKMGYSLKHLQLRVSTDDDICISDMQMGVMEEIIDSQSCDIFDVMEVMCKL